uniref:Uncharacterized protein n=1 Tax=Sipha flava TaxID=143950 RepID=A0A2S2QX66_9HEMI
MQSASFCVLKRSFWRVHFFPLELSGSSKSSFVFDTRRCDNSSLGDSIMVFGHSGSTFLRVLNVCDLTVKSFKWADSFEILRLRFFASAMPLGPQSTDSLVLS